MYLNVIYALFLSKVEFLFHYQREIELYLIPVFLSCSSFISCAQNLNFIKDISEMTTIIWNKKDRQQNAVILAYQLKKRRTSYLMTRKSACHNNCMRRRVHKTLDKVWNISKLQKFKAISKKKNKIITQIPILEVCDAEVNVVSICFSEGQTWYSSRIKGLQGIILISAATNIPILYFVIHVGVGKGLKKLKYDKSKYPKCRNSKVQLEISQHTHYRQWRVLFFLSSSKN